jgi:RNA polymerase sigma factor (sigma-70 family)
MLAELNIINDKEKFVRDLSLESLNESGIQFGDRGLEEKKIYDSQNMEWILSCLTKKQRKIVEYLFIQDKTRKETADLVGVKLQAVHQIVPRIRKRIRKKCLYRQ